MNAHRLTFAIFAASPLALSPIAFYSKSPLAFYRFDGTYLLVTVMMQKMWSVSEWYFTSNPLQGIGGLELPQHILIDPALWLVAHLPASIGPTAAMTFYAALLGVIICWLPTRLRMAPLPTIFAAWLRPLLALAGHALVSSPERLRRSTRSRSCPRSSERACCHCEAPRVGEVLAVA
jgi:hypothetical protein